MAYCIEISRCCRRSALCEKLLAQRVKAIAILAKTSTVNLPDKFLLSPNKTVMLRKCTICLKSFRIKLDHELRWSLLKSVTAVSNSAGRSYLTKRTRIRKGIQNSSKICWWKRWRRRRKLQSAPNSKTLLNLTMSRCELTAWSKTESVNKMQINILLWKRKLNTKLRYKSLKTAIRNASKISIIAAVC